MSQTLKIETILHSKRTRIKKGIKASIKEIFIEKQLLLLLVGLLLGRAVILYNISPFAIAFLATAWAIYQKRTLTMLIFILLGAWSQSIEHAVYISLSLVVFMFLTRFLKDRSNLKMLMLFVFLSTVVTRIFLYSLPSPITTYEWLHLLIEGVLGIVLLLIFMQSIPLLALKRYQPALKNEEIICIIILLASILTGFIGWEVYAVSLEHVFSRYIVLTLAFVGGAAIGSTVGVVTGLILSLANVANLYQMSLLAFSGLLGGLLQEGKKHGVSLGLLVGTFLVGIYGDMQTLTATMLESSIAILLFYLTPNNLLKQMSKYIPGTTEYSYEERKYLQKIRDVTAQRVEQYSAVFEALSKSFIQSTESQNEQEHMDETDYFLSLVTEKTCQMCFMKKRCWQNRFEETYSLMELLKNDLVLHQEVDPLHMKKFENHCVKSKQVIDAMVNEVSLLTINKKLKKQVVESKKIVADQLKGVSDVMDNFAKEIVKERQRHEKQEIQIVRALKQMDIHLEKIDIYQLEKGTIDIEMSIIFYDYHGEGSKLIAPVLSDILQETIIVKEEEISPFPNGVSFLTFGSARQYTVETGVAVAAKGGGLVSGDSYTTMELGKGKYALAISDGMGNGIRAREESMETLRLLEQILQTGISEQVAIQSINSILALRTTDEIFATLDLAIINLHNAALRFLKIGSSPSFIKRGDEVIQIEANNLPMGIIEYVDLETVSETLKSGDILIMMSDGVFDGPKQIKNNDLWLQRKIRNMKTQEPQAIADLLLEEVVRGELGVIRDDMTVVVAKIKKHKPKWATIPVMHSEAK
ncbi:stage II sporulation protein E [Pseudogracilibacillus auburnensis]|uniref:stage II sporulation protein E n=1 Tax=Pseudogracilibacillus auburnensis TaxID=1494959 RepID=UPI001A97095E|nr:stage II sporulation protein E [Pseudogracilibacillus auburnensis]MBO1004444.1 stage II sporulation protein E [Pseudogracilibacillus auburnensis]